MRIHYWQYLVDEEGRPLSGVEVYVYKAAQTDPVWLYPSETGGTAFKSYPVGDGGTLSDIILTGLDGFFEFWIGDQDEASGYSEMQKFKLAWYKTGVASGEIDYISIFTPIAEVDETDTSVTKNKMLSNFLAKKWNDHSDETILVDTPHDIEQVNETSTDVTLNKVVSNNLSKGWEDHKDLTHATGDPHDLVDVDETDTDATYNKLVNNLLSKGWEDHKDELTSTSDPHGITEVDDTSQDNTENKLVSNNLMYTRPYREAFDVAVLDWSGSGPYSADLVNTEHSTWQWNYPEVELWRDSTGMRVMPADIERLSASTIRLWISTAPATFGTSKAIVIG